MTNQKNKAARLFLVRHGETVGESSIRYHGRTDVPLSQLGREQMRLAARAIQSRHGIREFARVFASPLVRASEGAKIVAGRAAELVTIDDFAEVHFGLFEGLTAEEIRGRYPDEYARWNADRLGEDYTYPAGESRAAFAARVERGAGEMLRIWNPRPGRTGDDALLVAHRGVIRAIARKLIALEPVVELGSIQILHFDGGWHPTALDSIEHLDGS